MVFGQCTAAFPLGGNVCMDLLCQMNEDVPISLTLTADNSQFKEITSKGSNSSQDHCVTSAASILIPKNNKNKNSIISDRCKFQMGITDKNG